MDGNIILIYHSQFDKLRQVVTESYKRSISDPPDALFYDQQNVFIKSYLVGACSILEAFIQDLAELYVKQIQERVNAANLPFNFVVWVSNHDKAKLSYKRFEASIGKKEISELISPNYWKTMRAFERVGIDLSASSVDDFKDFVASTVDKRNKIVHHNDQASDVSFIDIIAAIDEFKKYTRCLFDAVAADPHISSTSA